MEAVREEEDERESVGEGEEEGEGEGDTAAPVLLVAESVPVGEGVVLDSDTEAVADAVGSREGVALPALPEVDAVTLGDCPDAEAEVEAVTEGCRLLLALPAARAGDGAAVVEADDDADVAGGLADVEADADVDARAEVDALLDNDAGREAEGDELTTLALGDSEACGGEVDGELEREGERDAPAVTDGDSVMDTEGVEEPASMRPERR